MTTSHGWRSNSDYSIEALRNSIESLIKENYLLTLSTVSPHGEAHSNTSYFAGTPERLVVFTPPSTIHARNLAVNARVSLTVFDSHQVWGSHLAGLQGVGTARLVDAGPAAQAAFETYAARFAGLMEWASACQDVYERFESRFYEIEVARYKVLDEVRFGSEQYIEIVRGND